MKYRHIGLIGKARSGKDTAAAALTRELSYTRLAFADALRTAALRANPWITYENGDGDWLNGISAMRLEDAIERVGWERAKHEHPEVRRFLQHFGSAMRDINDEIWMRPVMRAVAQGSRWNMPTVITDVRYRNEAVALRNAGVHLVRIVRPDAEGALSGAAAAHASETELDDFAADALITNSGSVEDMQDHILRLARNSRTA